MPRSFYSSGSENDVDESQEDVVIAVMGATGSGKSSFINLLTGEDSVSVGNSLESETDEVQDVSFVDDNTGRTVTLVDSPGFDDSREGISDTDILKKIANFLVEEYDSNRKLNGLIFVQRISDPRFSGQSSRNLRMFRGLCGTKTYQNVVIVTTFWDKVRPAEGEKREAQLKAQYFADLVRGGACFMRNNLTKDCANAVLRHVLKLPPVVTQIQQEIREEGKTLENTAAGSVHREEIERLIAQHNKEVADLKIEMDALKQNNLEEKRELEKERDKLREKLARWESEKAELKEGLDNERISRQKLEARLENQRHYREQTMQDKRRQDEVVREAVDRALHAERHKSYRRKGMELGKELPFIPNAIGQPVVGGLGFMVDVAKAIRRK